MAPFLRRLIRTLTTFSSVLPDDKVLVVRREPAMDGLIPAHLLTSTGGATWGNIGGTLSLQADLTAALNGKVATSDVVQGALLSYSGFANKIPVRDGDGNTWSTAFAARIEGAIGGFTAIGISFGCSTGGTFPGAMGGIAAPIWTSSGDNFLWQLPAKSGTFAMLDDGISEGTPVNAEYADATTTFGIPNSEILITAVESGTAGNSLVFAIGASSEIFISVAGNTITCDVDNGITTAAEVISAVNAHPTAGLLVQLAEAPGNNGSGEVIPSSYPLSGGVNGTPGGIGSALVDTNFLYVVSHMNGGLPFWQKITLTPV